jgi:hypothetical protein
MLNNVQKFYIAHIVFYFLFNQILYLYRFQTNTIVSINISSNLRLLQSSKGQVEAGYPYNCKVFANNSSPELTPNFRNVFS